jgi:magnesium transporter
VSSPPSQAGPASALPSGPDAALRNERNGASVIPDASAPAEATIRLCYRDGNGEFHAEWPIERVEEALSDQSGILWVDIQGTDEYTGRQLEDWLCRIFHFHPLAIEDALEETHVPKVDDWTDYLYVVFHVAEIKTGTEQLDLHELDTFLGRNYLVTYHVGPMAILDQDRQSIERDPRDRLRQGADHVLIRFLELAIDQSLKAIEALDERIDEIQNAVIEDASPRKLQEIFRVKRSAIRLHKILSPQREVLNRLARDPFPTVQPKHRVYFRDLYDHVVRIHDISEGLRDLVSSTLETYLSVVSNRTNDIMKILTIVTVMFMPMSFLVGFFGMNFFADTLAFTTWLPKGLLFWGSCAIMAVSPCFIWIYARRRKWF